MSFRRNIKNLGLPIVILCSLISLSVIAKSLDSTDSRAYANDIPVTPITPPYISPTPTPSIFPTPTPTTSATPTPKPTSVPTPTPIIREPVIKGPLGIRTKYNKPIKVEYVIRDPNWQVGYPSPTALFQANNAVLDQSLTFTCKPHRQRTVCTLKGVVLNSDLNPKPTTYKMYLSGYGSHGRIMTQILTLAVNHPHSQKPVITLPDSITVTPNSTVSYDYTVTDPDWHIGMAYPENNYLFPNGLPEGVLISCRIPYPLTGTNNCNLTTTNPSVYGSNNVKIIVYATDATGVTTTKRVTLEYLK